MTNKQFIKIKILIIFLSLLKLIEMLLKKKEIYEGYDAILENEYVSLLCVILNYKILFIIENRHTFRKKFIFYHVFTFVVEET